MNNLEKWCCLCMGGQISLSFCHADQILVPHLSLIRPILRLKLLAMHFNDDGILIQSLERSRELPVRPCAEQAMKVPLQPLQGSSDSAKCDDNSVSSMFPVYPRFHSISPDLLHLESAPAPKTTAGHTVLICALMCRDHSKIREF
jgi:hypothetical protein